MKILSPQDETSDIPTYQQTYQTIAFTIPDTLIVGAGQARFYMPRGGTITNILASVGTAPSGTDTIFDVNKNGGTIFTTAGNRPTITAGTNSDTASVPDSTSFVAGDYFTVDVDAASSAANAVVTIYFRWN